MGSYSVSAPPGEVAEAPLSPTSFRTESSGRRFSTSRNCRDTATDLIHPTSIPTTPTKRPGQAVTTHGASHRRIGSVTLTVSAQLGVKEAKGWVRRSSWSRGA